MHNTIAFSGANEWGDFRLSASNLLNESVVPNSGIKRNTFNLNLNSKLSRRLTISAIVNYIIETSKNRPNLSDSPGNSNFGITFLPSTLSQSVLQPGYKDDGNEIGFSQNTFATNPWFAANRFVNDLDRNRIIAQGLMKYNFTDWLYIQGRIGQDFYTDRNKFVTPTGTAYRVNGDINETTNRVSELNADFLVGFDKNVSEDLGINVSVGGNIMKSSWDNHWSSGQEFNVPFLYELDNTKNKNTGHELSRKEIHSLYYTAEISYKNFLFLNTTGREDWFSTLPVDNNNLFYPSVSASFVFSELWRPQWLNFGKIRVAWANTSGDAPPYQTQLYYSTQGAVNGYPIGVINNASVPNSQLQPYRMDEFEVGAELRMLENRLGFDIAYFTRKTIDEIVNVPTSPTSGYSGATVNIGQMKNSGFEFLIWGTPIKSKDFTWTSSFNFTKLENEVLQLAEGQKTLAVGQSRTQNAFVSHVVGLPASQVMAFDYKRDAKSSIVFDANGRPQQGVLMPMGSGYHDVFGGWNNDFNYKGFNLSVLIDFKNGGKIFSATNAYATSYGLHKMTLEGREGGIVGNGVKEDGTPNTKNEAAWFYYPALSTNVSSLFVYDASFIKLRQVVLGYNLPQKWFNKTPIQGINLSLVGRNLAVLDKKTPNIDPETNYSNTVAQGLELAGVPPYRSFGFNLNIKF